MQSNIITSRALRLVCLLLLCGLASPKAQTHLATAPASKAQPLILEKDQGELRVRRSLAGASAIRVASSEFMLKVSPQNGSKHLVLGTEQIQPGARIRTHKHLQQDEILLIQTGTARVLLGDQKTEVHAGGVVYIPANTWIGLQNDGPEAINLVFVFSAPGFEEYMRCTSVPAGQAAPSMTMEELKKCAHQGHVEYEDLQSPGRR